MYWSLSRIQLYILAGPVQFLYLGPNANPKNGKPLSRFEQVFRLSVVMNISNNRGMGLLLAVTILVTSLSMGGRVLCMGLDGHVAIEVGGWQGYCAEDETARPLLHRMSTSHCGPCLDYEIAIDRAPIVDGNILVPKVPDAPSAFAPVPPRRLWVPATILPPSQLAQHVVLII